ncbi:hypothetical protein ACJWDR_01710 [Streptomyces tauricus]|uniref:hypothetical protein n=1 Tax=Streptomyces tauricus TaxID=68274 RepID=UPI00387F239E
MRTTLTPEFYELFAMLLVAAVAVTVIVDAVADSLLVRLLRRMPSRPRFPHGVAPDDPGKGPTASPVRRTPVSH